MTPLELAKQLRTRKVDWRHIEKKFLMRDSMDGPLSVQAAEVQKLTEHQLGMQPGEMPRIVFDRAVAQPLYKGKAVLAQQTAYSGEPILFAYHPKAVMHEAQHLINSLRPHTIPGHLRKLRITPGDLVSHMTERASIDMVVLAVIQKSGKVLDDREIVDLSKVVSDEYRSRPRAK